MEKVTQDAVNDEKKGAYLQATLKLEKTRIDVDGKPIHLSAGMNVTAEIKTGKRPILEYPAVRFSGQSLKV